MRIFAFAFVASSLALVACTVDPLTCTTCVGGGHGGAPSQPGACRGGHGGDGPRAGDSGDGPGGPSIGVAWGSPADMNGGTITLADLGKGANGAVDGIAVKDKPF